MQFAAESRICRNGGRRSRTRAAQFYTQVYDKRRKEIRSQMSKELYE